MVLVALNRKARRQRAAGMLMMMGFNCLPVNAKKTNQPIQAIQPP